MKRFAAVIISLVLLHIRAESGQGILQHSGKDPAGSGQGIPNNPGMNPANIRAGILRYPGRSPRESGQGS